jgi:hypothetical protein
VLLYPGEKFSIGDILVLLSLEGNGINKLEVIPIDIALFNLLGLLLLLSPYLLLLGDVVVVDQFAAVEDILAILGVPCQLLQLLGFDLDDVGIGLDQFDEVEIALGGGT